MPLFKSNKKTVPAAAPVTTTQTHTTNNHSHRSSGGGFFSSHRRSTSTSPPASSVQTSGSRLSHHNSTSTGRGIFGGHKEDPSISGARARVLAAETAERDADRALVQARAAVRDARAQVAALEREAAEEARLAKIKQGQAADLNKRAKPLGRHDRI